MLRECFPEAKLKGHNAIDIYFTGMSRQANTLRALHLELFTKPLKFKVQNKY
jgi:hypothetical protein